MLLILCDEAICLKDCFTKSRKATFAMTLGSIMNWKLLLILVLISFSGCITTNAEINSQKYLYAGEKAVVPDSRDSVQKEYYLDGKLKSEIYSSYGQITHIRYFDEEDSYLFRQTDYLNGIPVATTTFDEKGSVESKTQY